MTRVPPPRRCTDAHNALIVSRVPVGLVGASASDRTGRRRGEDFRRLLGRARIGLSRIARRRGRRILHAIIVIVMCLSLGAQQTPADMAFWEWMYDTRVSHGVTWLTRMGILLAMILGFADACTRQAARGVRTLTQFLDFAASLWSRYAMSAEPDGVRMSFPIRLESSWLLTRRKAA